MKRLITLLLITGLAVSGLSALAPVPVSAAQSAAAAKKCVDDWDGFTFNIGDKNKGEAKKYSDSSCSKTPGGNCKAESNGIKDGELELKVSCTDKPATNTPKTQAEIDKEIKKLQKEGKSNDPSINTISDPALEQGSCNKSQCDLIARYVNPTINLLTILVGIAIVTGIIIGAIQVMTSAGDPQQAARGKNHIRSALIAAIGYVLLYAFLRFIIPRGL